MNSEKIKIPSNKNFGLVFFVFFLIILFYPLLNNENIRLWSLVISLIFLILGLLNSKILTPFNKLWINFGFLIGKFISPVIMSIIFFFSCDTNWNYYEVFKERFVKS